MLWPRTAQIRLAMTIKLHGMPPLPRYIATLQLQTSSNCSCVHVNVRNAVYLHKNCNSSARRRQQVPVKFQLHILTFRYHRSLHHTSELRASAASAAGCSCIHGYGGVGAIFTSLIAGVFIRVSVFLIYL